MYIILEAQDEWQTSVCIEPQCGRGGKIPLQLSSILKCTDRWVRPAHPPVLPVAPGSTALQPPRAPPSGLAYPLNPVISAVYRTSSLDGRLENACKP